MSNVFVPRGPRALPRVPSEAIQAALQAGDGQVQRLGTPFPGSTLYVPADAQPHAGVVLLHGSEGGDAGFSDLHAIELARRGFAALAYDYFGESPGLPPILAGVELERTMRAGLWLRESPHVRGQRVGLYGVSRGAEHAALIGAFSGMPFAAIAMHAPSSRVVVSFNPYTMGPAVTAYGGLHSAWTAGGMPLVADTEIPIENFRGPVYLSHGARDALWSVQNTHELAGRLRAAGREPELHIFPDDGHVLEGSSHSRQREDVAAFFERHLRASES